MDTIFIEGLEVEARIGVYDWEKKILQRLVFDIEVFVDIKAAATTDELAKTVDYKALSERVLAYVSDTQFELIEALAESLAQLLLQEFALDRLRLRVSKPTAVPEAKNVSLQIERSTGDCE